MHRGHQIEAWVVRFVRSMGIFDAGVPTHNMRLCTDRNGKNGKGRCAERFELTHMVDDQAECLWSVFEDSYGDSNANIKDNQGFLIHFTKEKEGGGWMTADLKPYVYETQNFRQIAQWLDCDLGDTIGTGSHGKDRRMGRTTPSISRKFNGRWWLCGKPPTRCFAPLAISEDM